VQSIKRLLTEYSYRSSEEVPARTIISLLESAIIEIARSQREVDALKQEINQLKSKETATKKEGE
jgi:Tfp pilus assembly protein PilN